MEGIVESTKSAVVGAKERLLKSLSFVPDDKLTWAPSSTAKSALGIGAHCVGASLFFAGALRGDPAPVQTFEELFAAMEAAEAKFTTRDQVVSGLEDSTKVLLGVIDSLSPARLQETITYPFFSFPVVNVLQYASGHMQGHAAQIDYLQTVWGDLDPHF